MKRITLLMLLVLNVISFSSCTADAIEDLTIQNTLGDDNEIIKDDPEDEEEDEEETGDEQ